MGSNRRRVRDRRAPALNVQEDNIYKPRAEYPYTEFYPDLDPTRPIYEFKVRGGDNYDEEDSLKKDSGPLNQNGSISKPGARVIDEFGKDIFVNQAMASIGYQETDEFDMPQEYIRSTGSTLHVVDDEDLGPNSHDKTALGEDGIQVEYDMDAQDCEFLKQLNERRVNGLSVPEISAEIFEITMTLFEIEWFKIEQCMPPKRKTVVVDELSDNNDEQKCCICDEAECDNSNAIVFCDGCDIAVHQDCYGVPFIPEGQWLCRQCMISRRRRASCVFCPNKSGALKQTDTQHWAHILCALWIPEITIANDVYMEPICDMNRIPKGRWKLQCYICHQKVGACIQCSNKNCFQAFHPTCARKARLCLRMLAGIRGAVHDPGTLLSFCDKHTPADYEEEAFEVHNYVRVAQKHYSDLVRSGRGAYPDNKSDRNIVRETKIVRIRKSGAPQWRTEQGTPAVPNITISKIASILNRFSIIKSRVYLLEVAKYWTLKRQYRRGAALTKRLQLALEAAPSETLSKNQAIQKLEGYKRAVADLEKLKFVLNEVRAREALKVEIAETQLRIVDLAYFPVFVTIEPLWKKVKSMCEKLDLLAFQETPNSEVVFKLDGPALLQKVETKQHDSVDGFIEDVENFFTTIVKGFSADSSPNKVAGSILRLVRTLAGDLHKSFSSIKLYENGIPNYGSLKLQGLSADGGTAPVVHRSLRKRGREDDQSNNEIKPKRSRKK